MFYFERDQDHCLLWPVLAVSLKGEFWIGIGWLNCEVGWRSADDGDKQAHAMLKAAKGTINV